MAMPTSTAFCEQHGVKLSGPGFACSACVAESAHEAFGQHTNACGHCRKNLFDLCPEGLKLMQRAVLLGAGT